MAGAAPTAIVETTRDARQLWPQHGRECEEEERQVNIGRIMKKGREDEREKRISINGQL